jgi:hypothetical protein
MGLHKEARTLAIHPTKISQQTAHVAVCCVCRSVAIAACFSEITMRLSRCRAGLGVAAQLRSLATAGKESSEIPLRIVELVAIPEIEAILPVGRSLGPSLRIVGQDIPPILSAIPVCLRATTRLRICFAGGKFLAEHDALRGCCLELFSASCSGASLLT